AARVARYDSSDRRVGSDGVSSLNGGSPSSGDPGTTRVGRVASVPKPVSPFPTCPAQLPPQHHTRELVSIPQVWNSPASRVANAGAAKTGNGSWSSLPIVPIPSWP